MEFKTWNNVVTYVYWLKDELPPSDPILYKKEMEKIKEFHISKGYTIPTEERC